MKKIILTGFALLFTTLLVAQSKWVNRASLPADARHHPVTFAIGNTGYLLGGTTGNGTHQSNDIINFANRDFYSYDPGKDTWVSLGNYPGPGRSFSYADTYNGKAYVGFGANPGYLNDLWEYDPDTDNWTQLPSCPCNGRRHPAFIAHRGKIFVGMGDNNSGNLRDWWEYDIDGDSWRQLPNLPGVPRHHPFHFKAGDHVYVGMGHGSSIFDDWYQWNIDDEEWVQMDDFSEGARVAGTELSHDGEGYVLSGDDSTHSTMPTGEFWKYDHVKDGWKQLPPHPGVSRWAPGSFVINDSVYFIAGFIRPGSNDAGFKNDMMMFQLVEDEDPQFVGEKRNANTDFSIYPNPAADFLIIETEKYESEKIHSAEIFNTTGQLVLSERPAQNRIDISALPAGMYLVKLKSENDLKGVMKFIKK